MTYTEWCKKRKEEIRELEDFVKDLKNIIRDDIDNKTYNETLKCQIFQHILGNPRINFYDDDVKDIYVKYRKEQ